MFTFESNIASFYPYALKGQKLSITRQYTTLLPLQGVLLNASIPRAAPWVCIVQACRPERAKAFNQQAIYKAFALTGRLVEC